MRADFRSCFRSNNRATAFQHIFGSLQDQLVGRRCLLHGCDCDPVGHGQLDVMMSGSPCDPFSVHSGKRFQSGKVQTHRDFSVTMDYMVQMYREHQPRIGIFEQVEGFVRPMECGSGETPYSRLA